MKCRICGSPAPNGILTGGLCDSHSREEKNARADGMRMFSQKDKNYIANVDSYVERRLENPRNHTQEGRKEVFRNHLEDRMRKQFGDHHIVLSKNPPRVEKSNYFVKRILLPLIKWTVIFAIGFVALALILGLFIQV